LRLANRAAILGATGALIWMRAQAFIGSELCCWRFQRARWFTL